MAMFNSEKVKLDGGVILANDAGRMKVSSDDSTWYTLAHSTEVDTLSTAKDTLSSNSSDARDTLATNVVSVSSAADAARTSISTNANTARVLISSNLDDLSSAKDDKERLYLCRKLITQWPDDYFYQAACLRKIVSIQEAKALHDLMPALSSPNEILHEAAVSLAAELPGVGTWAATSMCSKSTMDSHPYSLLAIEGSGPSPWIFALQGAKGHF